MPLIPCPECARQVSTEATACPQCGYPFPARLRAEPAPPPRAAAPVERRVGLPHRDVPVSPPRAVKADAKTSAAIIGVVVLAVALVWGVAYNVDYTASTAAARSLYGDSAVYDSADAALLDSLDHADMGESEPDDAWFVSEDTSRLDGARAVFLETEANEEVSGWPGNTTARPALVIRCQESRTELYVRTGLQPNIGERFGESRVRVRVDSGEVSRQAWKESSNREALFAPEPLALARTLAAADTFRFEFTPLQAAPQTVTFTVTGLDGRLPAIAEACGWTV